MTKVDLRKSLNAISDIIHNRPPALREFDQIYMKAADMLLQADHASQQLNEKEVVFIGDGDAISLCLVHLQQQGILDKGPETVHVLDFDERVIHSVHRFAKQHDIERRISAQLYNVIDPLPKELWERFDGFYTNPPFGASNGGRSIEAFLVRALEATTSSAKGCIVIADDEDYEWTQEVLFRTQKWLLDKGLVISEMVPEFHQYHLDDAPALTSCSLAVQRLVARLPLKDSRSLDPKFVENFYGTNAPLRVRYVRDRTGGGRFPSRDYELEPLEA